MRPPSAPSIRTSLTPWYRCEAGIVRSFAIDRWSFRELEAPETLELLRAFVAAAEEPKLLRATAFVDMVRAVGRERGLKGQKLFHPLRLALTGESSGMELGKMVPLMARLPDALERSVPGPLTRVRAILEALGAGDEA